MAILESRVLKAPAIVLHVNVTELPAQDLEFQCSIVRNMVNIFIQSLLEKRRR